MTKRIFVYSAVVVLWLGMAIGAMAEISQDEASELGGDVLTAVGAEKKGSEDGTIPPYTGGLVKKADGWYYENVLKVSFSDYDPQKNDKVGVRPDPFKDDGILYTITADNLDQYADKLSPGTQAIFHRYPDFRINVYPTRRSAAYSPEIIEGTKTSALSAKLEKDGINLTGAHHGFPFPIPKNGLEVVWNHLVRWSGTVEHMEYKSYVVNAAGRKTMTSNGLAWLEYPYWDIGNQRADTYLCMIKDNVIAPPNRNGEGLIWSLKIDKSQGDLAYQYLPGQRRVKLAPEIAYDGPNTSVAGAATYDESYVFNGSPDRFNWKIIGKKELIVPYNQYKLVYHSTADAALGENFIKPDFERWEVHRTWVIEGTLKEGKRHIYNRRVIYIDEDSWYGVVHDTYDHNNEIYRVIFDKFVFNYDYPAPSTTGYVGYDLISGIYYFNAFNAETGGLKYIPRQGEKDWAPASLAGSGIR